MRYSSKSHKIPFILAILFIASGSFCYAQQDDATFCAHSKSAHRMNSSLRISDDRLEQFDVRHVFLDLQADNLSTQIEGSVTLTLESRVELTELVLELIDELVISEILVNETSSTFTHENDLVVISLTEPLAAGELLECKIGYAGNPVPNAGIFSGINNEVSGTWGNQVTWTLSEPFNAKTWWPCKQVLGDKIDSAEFHITTQDHLMAGSNGLLTTVPLENNMVRYEWKTSYPIAYYLLSMTIAEYVEYNNYARPDDLNGDSILIQNFIYSNPETLPTYQENLDRMPRMIELFSDYFGLYPFYKEKYGHAMAPFGGGMEHQTMSTMGVFAFTLDAHELGHQWFGDYVTCGTWQDIWINEGFAQFSEYLAVEKLVSRDELKELRLSDMQGVLNLSGGSVYVPDESKEDENRIFNYPLTYLKGGLILYMLREVINNDDLFYDAMRTYIDIYKNSTATGEQFKEVMEAETGLELDPFFDLWYYGEGYPLFDITWQPMGDSLKLDISQTTTSATSLFTTPLEFVIRYEDREADTVRVSQSTNSEVFTLPVRGKIVGLEFDPDEWLIKGVSSFVKLDENGQPLLGLEDEKILLFPNPAHSEIRFDQAVSNIHIFSSSGRLLLSAEQTANLIDIRSLKEGIYLMQFVDHKGKKQSKKLIVKK